MEEKAQKRIKQKPVMCMMVQCPCGARIGEGNPSKLVAYRMQMIVTVKCQSCDTIIELSHE